MTNLFSSIRQFLSELRRRNVYRVAVTYVVVGFFVIEGADLVLTRLGLPSWTVTLVIVLVGAGFPIALVLAWALEMAPEGVRVEETASEGGISRPTSTPRDLWVGASVLALLLLGVWWMWGGYEGGAASEKAGKKSPETKERSIAVLPFEVTGAGAKDWRDGMVTMLSMNLDGAAGLRAISERTVLAAWERRDSAQVGASTRKALAVAQDIGAKYAILGSAVQLGEELRLGVEVRRVDSGKSLGEVEVEGSPGDVTALTDRLTRKVLGVLLDRSEEAIPSVDLASITTESLPALKDYLEGERHFRAGKYEAAIEDYRAATEKDSTFALAYARLGLSLGWSGTSGEQAAIRRAHSLSSRLPLRERRLVWAQYAWKVLHRSLTLADSLRALTEVYPDDPQVWYHLGEVLVHGRIPGGWAEAEKAFLEATTLDPGVAPYHQHLMDAAMVYHRDSALAARRIDSHPEGPIKEVYRASWDLAFGTPEQQEAALARLDTLSLPQTQSPWWAWYPLEHPRHLALQAQVIETLRAREDTDPEEYVPSLARNRFDRGQVEEGLSLLRAADAMSCYRTAVLRSRGLPVPDSTFRRALKPSTLGASAPLGRLFCGGLWAIEEGRGERLSQILSWMERNAGENSVEAAAHPGEIAANELKGYRAYKRGNRKRAARLWSTSKLGIPVGALWRGDLYRDLGKLEKAERWYIAAWRLPEVHERLGQLYEKMGKPEKAKAAYRRFIEAWKNADPQLQDRVREARRRLKVLREPEAKKHDRPDRAPRERSRANGSP